MQNTKIILTQLTMEELQTAITQAVKTEIAPIVKNIQPTPPELRFISRSEVCKLFGVSLPTIDNWTRTGKLKGYRIGNRIRYKASEVEKSLTQINTGR